MATRGQANFLTVFIVILLILIGIFVSLRWAHGQEPEPAAPASVDEVLYTIDADQDFQILSVIPANPDWIVVPIASHAVVTLAPSDQNHSFFQMADQPHVWYVPIPDTTSRFMRIEIEDTQLSGIFLFRVRARMRPYVDGVPLQGPTEFSTVSWWVARVSAVVGRAIFARRR